MKNNQDDAKTFAVRLKAMVCLFVDLLFLFGIFLPRTDRKMFFELVHA